ncbi:hypothetical protein F5141DRAFT_659579 [Pisolithus sp. B1]|nr:hypothetical protein F5141DRAFT_659579 [Pisolithus sp. B1]
MTYNQFQSSNQPQTHAVQQTSYPPGSGMTSPISGYSVPPQSYNQRCFQRAPQQPSGFQYMNQQVLPRAPFSHRRMEHVPQSQPFRQTPALSVAQTGYQFVSGTIVPSPSGSAAQTLGHAAAVPPPPPSSFHSSVSYSSPRHQTFPQPATPTSSSNFYRRPLPTPKPRPESLPPPSRHTPQIQAPAPSRPAILTHTASLASIDAPSTLSSPSSTTSSNGSRRPLPTPQMRSVKHTSLDLRIHSTSPVKASIPDKLLPSLSRPPTVPSKHNVPSSGEQSDRKSLPSAYAQVSSRDIAGDGKMEGPSSPTKFVPLWKRELQTSPSPAGNILPAMGRRSTVSGQPVPKTDVVQCVDLPDTMDKASEFGQTSPGRPLPLLKSSAVPGGVGVAQNHVTHSMHTRPFVSFKGDENEYPSRPDIDEEEPIVFAKPEDDRDTPSPQYGIRDLPQRHQKAVANHENIPGNTFREGGDIVVPNGATSQRDCPTRSATLPYTPSSVISTGSRTPTSDDTFKLTNERSSSGQSLTFRLAALGLAGELGSTNQTRQLPNSRWHTSASAPQHNPVTQTEFRGRDVSKNISASDSGPAASSCPTDIGNPPPRHNIPKDSHIVAFRQMSERQREKQREVVDLDDAPPPSLRRSPSPARATSKALPSIQISGSPPQRQWTPSKNSRAESPNGGGDHFRPAGIPSISILDNRGNGVMSSPVTTFSDAPAVSASSPDPPLISISPPTVLKTDSAHRPTTPTINFQPSDSQPPRQHGTRYTKVQETATPKRTLPPVPIRSGGLFCGGCKGSIVGRIVSAMGSRWHPGCFRCTICNELLEHVSSYEHEGKPYCHLDYHEAFAPKCFHCKTAIVDERFITLDDPALGKRTYHEQHFFCSECGDPFLAPSGTTARSGELNVSGDGDFEDDNVCFTVYKGYPLL